jgi:hypothetical protein
MILGIDTGLATCGWALLDETTRRFVDLGVVITKPAKDALVTLDRARRLTVSAKILAEKAPGCSMVVVERMSFPPGAGMAAAVPIALSWGAVVGVISMMSPRPELLTVSPQRWQREILPNAGKQVDYDELARNAAAYILANHPAAAKALRAIKEAHRNHAIDAAMLALMGALRPGRCERIAA